MAIFGPNLKFFLFNYLFLDSLQLEIERLKFDHVLQMQLLEEKLRKELTDTYQEIIKDTKKQLVEECEKKLYLANREWEFKVA